MQPRPLAIVTGASRGIGAAVAAELASRGYDVAVTDIDSSGVADTLKSATDHGAQARFFRFDLSDCECHQSVIDSIVQWAGPVSCLVNNAGIPALRRGDLLEVTTSSFDRVLDVNLRGTFFFTQQLARHMLVSPSEHCRSIITVSSVSAEMASAERGEYCLSKAGLGMLTKLFALRLADAGIGVFEVRPGIIRTPMTAGIAPSYNERIANGLVPQKRWGTPQDVARAVAALASGDLGFCSGSVMNVDGALSVPRL